MSVGERGATKKEMGGEKGRPLSLSLLPPHLFFFFPSPPSLSTASSVVDLVGGTPLVRLRKVVPRSKDTAKVFAKLESLQPNSSVKDR